MRRLRSMANLSPALDIIRTRPSDPAHSEFGRISKMTHLLFIDQILVPASMQDYGSMLRRFLTPSY